MAVIFLLQLLNPTAVIWPPSRIPVPSVNNVIDTTGAGDTFNAGYLAARLQNASAEDAVHQAIRCAGIIIRHRGAVIEKSVFAKELAMT